MATSLWPLFLWSYHLPTLLRPSYNHSGPTCIIQGTHPIPRSLGISPKFILPCKGIYSQVPRIKTWTYLGEGALICLPQESSFLCSKRPMLWHLKKQAGSYKGIQGPAWSSHTYPITTTKSPWTVKLIKLKLQSTSLALSFQNPGSHTRNVFVQEILLFPTTWMGLGGIMLSIITQTEKDKYYLISLIH